ncbi:MAG: LON peptidase substrate-binding domain-containing protein [Nitrospinales bacterium]
MADQEALQNPISLFPLPSSVFYPGTFLPLHIFEPRYRQMVRDALDNRRLIGMVLLKPGWEENYYDRPEVAAVGCAGNIDKAQPLADGKFNIVLRGVSRFRILHEIGGQPFRLAQVEFLEEIHDETSDFSETALAARLLACYENYIGLLPPEHPERQKADLAPCRRFSHFVDRIAYRFDLNLERKQAFLEETDVRKRAETLISMLVLKIRIAGISKSQNIKGIDGRMN